MLLYPLTEAEEARNVDTLRRAGKHIDDYERTENTGHLIFARTLIRVAASRGADVTEISKRLRPYLELIP